MSQSEEPKLEVVFKNLDLTNSARGIWLVKLPKYVAEKFRKAPRNMEVGKLRIGDAVGQKQQLALVLSEACLNMEPETQIPRVTKLEVSQIKHQKLLVFSYVPPQQGTKNPVQPEPKDLRMEGTVVQKLECVPIASRSYMQMKKDAIREAAIPKRQVQAIDRVVRNFKPVRDHAHNIEDRNRRKAEGKKARDDKNIVMNKLFKAFEHRQYYNIKDLVQITRQPMTYLKEILKEMCDYNTKNPNKNMWELKKEYRHYKIEEMDTVMTDNDFNS